MGKLLDVLDKRYGVTLEGDDLDYFLNNVKSNKILGNNFEQYYFDEKNNLLYKSIPWNDYIDHYFKIKLSYLTYVIKNIDEKKLIDNDWDTTKAKEIIKNYGDKILAKEREFFTQLAYATLYEIDNEANWEIFCNGQLVENLDDEYVKKLTK